MLARVNGSIAKYLTIRELIGSVNASAFIGSSLPTRRHYFRPPGTGAA
jgi:hypothetical protein